MPSQPLVCRHYSREDIEHFWSPGHCKVDMEAALDRVKYRHQEDNQWKVEMDVLVDAEEWGLDLEDLDEEEYQ